MGKTHSRSPKASCEREWWVKMSALGSFAREVEGTGPCGLGPNRLCFEAVLASDRLRTRVGLRPQNKVGDLDSLAKNTEHTMKSAITVSLVEEARGGPFVFWDGLADCCERASALGFDAIEIFPPSTDAVDAGELNPLLEKFNLKLAALGTGAGMVKHGLSLTNADADHRAKARAFVKQIVDKAAEFGASAIIGSMQGKWGNGTDKATALGYLGEALNECGDHAATHGVPLIYEPLNRYETNLCNTVADGVNLLESTACKNVVLLADLFHMNIEEENIADALRHGGKHIGHVHFVDSNRRPTGLGHMDYAPIAAALKEIGYEGYACAEAFPYPDSQSAAESTMDAFKKYLA